MVEHNWGKKLKKEGGGFQSLLKENLFNDDVLEGRLVYKAIRLKVEQGKIFGRMKLWMKLNKKTPNNNLLTFPWGKRKKGKLDKTSSDFGVASLFAEVEEVEGSNNETSSDKPEKEALRAGF